MFQKKITKENEPEKGPYSCHNVAIPPSVHSQWDTIISIDPGITNFGFRIEQRYNGEFYKTLAYSYATFKQYKDSPYNQITQFLNWFNNLYSTCNVFIIERQLPINYKRIRVEQHVISYFLEKCSRREMNCSIYDIQSSMKTQQLNAPKKMNDNERKKWAVEVAYKLSHERQDQFSLDVLNSVKKKDDISDSLVQIEGWYVFCRGYVTRTY